MRAAMSFVLALALVAGCATTGTNENSFLNFAAGPTWWVFGVGNCIACDEAC